jgi:hypothetical protein
MNESQFPCPICARSVGDTHNDFCPRSRVQVAARRGVGPARVVYLAKGVDMSVRNGESVVVRNPGFPYVDCTPKRVHGLRRTERRLVKRNRRKGLVPAPDRKDWTAGGLPLGFDRESALEFMREQAVRPASDFVNPKQKVSDDTLRPQPTPPSQDPPTAQPSEPNEDGQRPSAASSEE